MSRKEVLEKIKTCELNKEFHEHVDPINFENSLPVDENFHYINRTILEKVKFFFERIFIVKPFILYINKIKTKTKVIGKKNLKGIKNAVLTCNHVYMFDCLVATYAVKPHKLFITAATFNNQKGFLGEMMRAGNMMPFGGTSKAIRNFNEAIEYHLTHNRYVLFYPEEAMWWMYDKPRPHRVGAYHYAIKHNVPIIPLFITFTNTKKLDKEGIPIKKFTMHIMKPLCPDNNLSKKENLDLLINENQIKYKQKYEEFYKKPLNFNKR